MSSYGSVEEMADRIREDVGGKSGEYAAEIVQYVMDDDASYIGRLCEVSDTYSAKQLVHGLRALPDVLEEDGIEDIDDLQHARSRAKTWKFHRIREALEGEIGASDESYATA